MQEQALTGYKVDKLFFFDTIPPNKLENAINTYAGDLRNADSCEIIVCLYDDTTFGSAKDGFIMSTKRLYFRNDMSVINSVDIDDIVEITHKKGLSFSSFILRTNFNSFDISIKQQEQREAKTTFFGVFQKIIKRLKGSDIATCVAGEGADTAGSVIGGIFDFLTS
jgi:hypothetical protein